jgi:hypothetical protein|tara:strand:+ start:138 stop:602 length:465 start_codon:yes stop_codon:yes gene_type:complete
MKHLREYEEQDIKDLMGDMETIGQAPLKGWIVSVAPFDTESTAIGAKYYAITADNVKEAYALIAEDWIYEEEDLDSFVEEVKNFTDLSEDIGESTDYQMGFVVLGVWEGLRSTSKKAELVVIEGVNPFEAGRLLSQKFINAQSVMAANPKGNSK